MTEMVITGKNGQNVTTSLIVAEVFEKEHKHVIRDIKNLACSNEFIESNFGLIQRISDLGHGRTRQDPYYEMTKDGFAFLVMGYTGAKAAQFKEKFITEFNNREQIIKKQTEMLQDDEYILQKGREILERRVSDLQKRLQNKEVQVELQQKVIQEAAPKVQYYNEVLTSESTHNTNNIAFELGMSAQKLNMILKQKGVQYKQGGQWLLYMQHRDKGYTKTITHTYTNSSGIPQTSVRTVWTEKGRLFIHRVVKEQVSVPANSDQPGHTHAC
jgi:Rha family phage regulatory protein